MVVVVVVVVVVMVMFANTTHAPSQTYLSARTQAAVPHVFLPGGPRVRGRRLVNLARVAPLPAAYNPSHVRGEPTLAPLPATCAHVGS